MNRQCTNTECNAFIEDESRFCKICGSPQQEQIKEKKGFFGKKKQIAAQADMVKPDQLEDFRMARPQVFQQPKKTADAETFEALQRLEQKLDIVLGNHSWLLANIDNWLQGYKKQKEQEEIETAKNI